MHTRLTLLCGLVLLATACMHATAVSAARHGAHQNGMAGMHAPLTSQHARHLLHGSKPPGGWDKCGKCSLISCNPSGACSGHCRRKNKLYNCIGRYPSFYMAPPVRADDFVAIATAPHIGCSIRTGCAFQASQIAPRRGYTVAADSSGAAAARCETTGSLSTEYGACVCTYKSTNGNGRRQGFCEPTAALEPSVLRFDAFAEEVAAEYLLEVEVKAVATVPFANEVANVTVAGMPFAVEITVDGVVVGLAKDSNGREISIRRPVHAH